MVINIEPEEYYRILECLKKAIFSLQTRYDDCKVLYVTKEMDNCIWVFYTIYDSSNPVHKLLYAYFSDLLDNKKKCGIIYRSKLLQMCDDEKFAEIYQMHNYSMTFIEKFSAHRQRKFLYTEDCFLEWSNGNYAHIEDLFDSMSLAMFDEMVRQAYFI